MPPEARPLNSDDGGAPIRRACTMRFTVFACRGLEPVQLMYACVDKLESASGHVLGIFFLCSLK